MKSFIYKVCCGVAFFSAVVTTNSLAQDNQVEISSELSTKEAQVIAKEAYLYGFPMVMNYKTMFDYVVDKGGVAYKAPFNQMSCEARVYTPEDKTIVTPNSDTPYCMAWMDLRAEPIVLTVPKLEGGRYYSFQFIDLYTHNFSYVGTLNTGNDAAKFLIVGPDWKGEKPNGVESILKSETAFAFIIARTQLLNDQDLGRVKEIQSEYSLETLSSYQGSEAPVNLALPDFPQWAEGAQFDERFFEYFNFMLSLLGVPGEGEGELWEEFARIGLGPKADFKFESLNPKMREAMKAGVIEGVETIEVFLQKESRDPLASAKILGTREFLNKSAKENYQLDNPSLLRAAAAHMGLYGNSGTEAIYPTYLADADGVPLDASKNGYTLTFGKGLEPPVKAFWSLTMYDAKTQLLVENPINRYLLNSNMQEQFKRGDDGSLTIYLSKEKPDGMEENWLPAPDGPFYAVLRLYGPEEAALQGEWVAPVLKKVNRKCNAF